MKLLFDHVEKCGGRTVLHYLKTAYGIDNIELLAGNNQYAALERAFVGNSLKPCIAGHGAHHLIPLVSGYTTATILRYPVDRVISLYRYCKQEEYFPRTGNVKKFLNDINTSRNYYAWRFSRILPAEVSTCPELSVHLAVSAILKYNRIGFTDNLTDFIQSLGLSHPYTESIVNQTTFVEEISPGDRELIRQANLLDIQIYEQLKKQTVKNNR